MLTACLRFFHSEAVNGLLFSIGSCIITDGRQAVQDFFRLNGEGGKDG